MPKISMIAAIAKENRALGKDGNLIYKISDDLKRFKEITLGHVVIMGRKTFESIGRPLPSRINIVVTKDPNYPPEGIIVVHSLEEALRLGGLKEERGEVFIIGGGQIYREAIDKADKLYLTIVEGNPQADTFFPDYSDFKKVVFEERRESEGLKYKFLDLEK